MVSTDDIVVDAITRPVAMVLLSVGMAGLWGVVLETSKSWIYGKLRDQPWWSRHAVKPTIQMMQNFGYPKTPTPTFPRGVTEEMARDFYAFLTTLCFQHGLSALPMIPVVWYGWANVSVVGRVAFVLGTLSDVGFDIYDSAKSSWRTFAKNHSAPLPLDFWIVIVAMHHTLALSLVLPMNSKYIQLAPYHQTVASLLLAAAVCYGAGCYKFTLNVKTKSGFAQYKAIVVFQLAVILYTRLYLWFPAAYGMIQTFRKENDAFFLGASLLLGLIFSIFNLLLVADAVGAAVKWLPRPMPRTEHELNDLSNDATLGTGPATAMNIVSRMRRRKLKAAAHSVIAINKMKKKLSAGSSSTTTKNATVVAAAAVAGVMGGRRDVHDSKTS